MARLSTLRPRLLPARTAPAGWRDDARGSPEERGYGYAWRKLRAVILARDAGLCQCPQCQGGKLRVTPANEVHHVIGKAEARALGWTAEQVDDPSNLQAINRDCHAVITARQGGRKG